jgi:hypothetical protein
LHRQRKQRSDLYAFYDVLYCNNVPVSACLSVLCINSHSQLIFALPNGNRESVPILIIQQHGESSSTSTVSISYKQCGAGQYEVGKSIVMLYGHEKQHLNQSFIVIIWCNRLSMFLMCQRNC